MAQIICLAAITILLAVHAAVRSFGTQIGEKGRRNVITANVLCIAEAVFVIALCQSWPGLWAGHIAYGAGTVAVGAVLLLSGAAGLFGALGEPQGSIVTEALEDVRIIPAGFL